MGEGTGVANLQDYVRWRGDLTFEERGFNMVDNLVLVALAYLDLDGIVPGRNGGGHVTVKDAAVRMLARGDEADVRRLNQVPTSLLSDLAETARFGSARLSRYVDIIDPGEGVQFAALTVELGDGTVFVAFRGTDMTIVGWREDFVMSFELMPAQVLAAGYLQQVLEETDRPVRVGGHSKGGNLAVYAAARAAAAHDGRINAVYCDDGPGMGPEAAAAACTGRIEDRVVRIAPTFSVVGMLFASEPPDHIVASDARGLAQHDLMTWQVEGTDLVGEPGLDPLAVEINAAVAGYLDDADLEERRKVTEAVFGSLSAGGAVLIQDVAATSFGGVELVLLSLLRSRGQLRKPVRHGIRSVWRTVSSVDYAHLLRQAPAIRFMFLGVVGIFLIRVPGLGVQIFAAVALAGLSVLAVWRLTRVALRLRKDRSFRLPHLLIASGMLLLMLYSLTRIEAFILPANLFVGISFVLGAWASVQAGLRAINHAPPRVPRGVVLLVNAGVALLFGIVTLTTADIVVPLFVQQAGQYLLLVGLGGLALSVWDGASGIRQAHYLERA